MSDELNVINEDEKSGRGLRKVYVTAGVVGVIMLILVSALTIASPGDDASSTGACHSESCHLLGDQLNATVNAAEQPCANFYRFVCSGRPRNVTPVRDKWETVREAFYKVESNPRIPFKGQTEAQKFLTFYLSCYRSLAPGSSSIKNLKRFLHYFDFPWPKVHVNTLHAFDLLIRMELDFNIGAFFRFGISLKRKNAWDFSLKPPKPSNFLYSSTRKEKYRRYLDKVVKMMGGGIKHSGTVDAIIQMESDLFELAVLERKQRVHIKNLALLTKVVTPQVWMETFSKYYILSQFLGNHTMVITSPEYFRRLFSALAKKEGALYLGWRLLRFGGCFTNEIRALEETNQMSVDTCSHPVYDPRDFCKDYASRMMLPQYLAFLTEALTSRQEISGVSVIVENVHREIIKGLSLNPWLDNATRTVALSKLNSIEIALPVIGEKRNKSTFSVPDMGADFLGNWVRVVPEAGFPARDYQIDEAIKRLYDDDIQYNAQSNTLHVPIGSMKLPFHATDLPASATYASCGRVVAHELLHSLDDDGHWWSEEFTEIHNARAACYVRLYEMIGNVTNSTTQEDVIDSAAVRYAYAAFKAALPLDRVSNTLGGLEPFNAEQTFFITYCYSFCDQQHGEGAMEYRCNIPLMNMEEFAHAFSCGPKDAMNPSQKCYFW
ncbi:neprilysin-1-like [Ornithodoros turicata]|uniref:neprilysin-1-like n=1 Tax=Ornithodoros turicata TaxID=34597 RepID=UPI0031397A16